MAKANRKCKTCGKEYYFCPTCGTHEPSWRKVYDTEECKISYETLARYNFGHIDAAEAIKTCTAKFVDEDLVEIVKKMKREARPVVKEEESKEKKSLFKKDIVNEG